MGTFTGRWCSLGVRNCENNVRIGCNRGRTIKSFWSMGVIKGVVCERSSWVFVASSATRVPRDTTSSCTSET